jgi:hypothetical protein
MRCFFCHLVLVVCATALCQTSGVAKADQARFFKCEGGVSADYLELAPDNTYRVIAREHMGVWQVERGRWRENGSTITFTPSSHMRGGKTVNADGKSYNATEVQYKSNTFLAFKSDEAAGIAIPIDETKQQLDNDPRRLPEHVFFKTTAKVFAQETKQTYPFRYLKPDK